MSNARVESLDRREHAVRVSASVRVRRTRGRARVRLFGRIRPAHDGALVGVRVTSAAPKNREVEAAKARARAARRVAA